MPYVCQPLGQVGQDITGERRAEGGTSCSFDKRLHDPFQAPNTHAQSTDFSCDLRQGGGRRWGRGDGTPRQNMKRWGGSKSRRHVAKLPYSLAWGFLLIYNAGMNSFWRMVWAGLMMFFAAGCAPTPGGSDDTAASSARATPPTVGGICEGAWVPALPDLRAPGGVALALDARFDPPELETVLDGFDAWGISVASVSLLPPDAPVPPGALAVARCEALRDPKGHAIAGAQRGGALGFKAPLVSVGLVAHEIGHALGLAHSPRVSDVMHTPVRVRSPSPNELAAVF
jgi:Matrixin